MVLDNAAVARLKVVAEADPGALVRVLHSFQGRNLVPLRTVAHRIGASYLEIEIDLDAAECAPEVLRIVIAKLNELPVVLTAVACER